MKLIFKGHFLYKNERINIMEQKIICTSCDREIGGDEQTYMIHGDIICEDCADGKTVICDRCGERIWDCENEGDENITLCTSCYDNYYTTCENCEAVINTDDVIYDDDDRPYAPLSRKKPK